MQLLPMRDPEDRPRGGTASLACGATSLSIGLGAMVLLVAYLWGIPIGSPEFYEVQTSSALAPNASGTRMVWVYFTRIVPSNTMLWTISFGGASGGLGVYLGLSGHKARLATTSAVGLITCSIAMVLVMILAARAAKWG